MLRKLAIIGLIALGLPRLPGAPPETATIVDSGSTNRAGFRIVVDRSGASELTPTPRRRGGPQQQTEPIQRTLPRDTTDRFYADLDAAKPLAALPAGHCMKSVSFGSVLTIEFGGEQTPDLSCGEPGNTAMRKLVRDANEIVAIFHAR